MTRSIETLLRLLELIPLATRTEGVGLDEAARELGVDVDQVVQDIETLTERSYYLSGGSSEDLQVHLEGDRVRIFSPGAFTRPLRLTRGELLALSVALRADGVEDADARALCRSVEEALAVGRPEPDAEIPTDLHAALPDLARDPEGIRDALSEALLTRRAITFGYLKPGAAAPEVRTLEPWRLLHAEGEWYVVGRDPRRDAKRLFRVDRILGLRLTEARFDPDPDFDPTSLVRDGQVALEADGTEPASVEVRYSPRVARQVAERAPGEPLDDGGYLVRHRVYDRRWLLREIMRHGGDAEVV
ncbi:MAG: WYL domain-containing protein [Longimicrobiales bacterium]|nr:WYL domain-containing protein [Longimicrobiales bacterium]